MEQLTFPRERRAAFPNARVHRVWPHLIVPLAAWSIRVHGVFRTAQGGGNWHPYALGAQRSAVMRLVLRQGAILLLSGIALGFEWAWSVTLWMRSRLFEVQPTDPLTFGEVATLFCAVAAITCFVPARRATMVDPMTSLR